MSSLELLKEKLLYFKRHNYLQVNLVVYALIKEEISNGKLIDVVVLIGDKERINEFIYENIHKFYKEGGSFLKRKKTEDRLYEVWELQKPDGDIIELRFYVFGDENIDSISIIK